MRHFKNKLALENGIPLSRGGRLSKNEVLSNVKIGIKMPLIVGM